MAVALGLVEHEQHVSPVQALSGPALAVSDECQDVPLRIVA